MVRVDKLGERGVGFGCGRVEDGVIEDGAVGIEDGELAAGAMAGIEGEDALVPEG